MRAPGTRAPGTKASGAKASGARTPGTRIPGPVLRARTRTTLPERERSIRTEEPQQ